MSVITVNIDAKLKAEADAVLQKRRLTPTDAVSLLYALIVSEQKLPFDLSAEEIHLFRSSVNARCLLEAMAEIAAGGVVEFDPTK